MKGTRTLSNLILFCDQSLLNCHQIKSSVCLADARLSWGCGWTNKHDSCGGHGHPLPMTVLLLCSFVVTFTTLMSHFYFSRSLYIVFFRFLFIGLNFCVTGSYLLVFSEVDLSSVHHPLSLCLYICMSVFTYLLSTRCMCV